MRGRRWTGNAFGFAAALLVVVLTSGVLAWAAPRVFDLTISKTGANGDSVTQVVIETSGVERVMAAVGELDVKASGTNAVQALEQSLCAALPASPLASRSIVTGDGGATQAIVLAMPPGTGTWVAQEVIASMPQCLGVRQPETSAPWMPSEAATFAAFATETSVWARGDFVVIASGDSDDAERIDFALSTALRDNRCLNLEPSADDYFENKRVAGDEYRAPTVGRIAEVEAIDPEGPDAEVLPVPTTQDTTDPGTIVEVPEVPDGRTYWPEMPAVVTVPSIQDPQEQPPLTAAVRVLAEDTAGPGCGWAFFAYEPVPTTAATTAEEAKIVNAAETSLDGAWQAWAASVEAFWSQRDAYEKDVEAYSDYRASVAEVSRQWETEAAPLWDQYEALLSTYDSALEVRRAWLVDRNLTQTEWDEFLATCTPAEGVDEDPTLSTSPAPEPTPPPEPTADGKSCDSRLEPKILSDSGPSVPDAPVEPTAPEPTSVDETLGPESGQK